MCAIVLVGRFAEEAEAFTEAASMQIPRLRSSVVRAKDWSDTAAVTVIGQLKSL